MTDVIDVYLPKWPQMLVWGPAISAQQAMEIIMRTDSFWESAGTGGNNEHFQQRLCAQLGLPRRDYSNPQQEWMPIAKAWQEFQENIGYVDTTYVDNDWISSCYIGGPHGWCHPDGTIRYTDNVGKWPSLEEILDDWQKIAQAWPFLELEAALMSGEHCDADTKIQAVISVSQGKAEAFDSTYPFLARFNMVLHEAFANTRGIDDFVATFIKNINNVERENLFDVKEICLAVNHIQQNKV